MLLAEKTKFHDEFMDTDLELGPQEIIDYGIYVLEDELEPEAYSEEVAYYEETLDLLKDDKEDMNERVNKAIDVLEIVNIYQVA